MIWHEWDLNIVKTKWWYNNKKKPKMTISFRNHTLNLIQTPHSTSQPPHTTISYCYLFIYLFIILLLLLFNVYIHQAKISIIIDWSIWNGLFSLHHNVILFSIFCLFFIRLKVMKKEKKIDKTNKKRWFLKKKCFPFSSTS